MMSGALAHSQVLELISWSLVVWFVPLNFVIEHSSNSSLCIFSLSDMAVVVLLKNEALEVSESDKTYFLVNFHFI